MTADPCPGPTAAPPRSVVRGPGLAAAAALLLVVASAARAQTTQRAGSPVDSGASAGPATGEPVPTSVSAPLADLALSAPGARRGMWPRPGAERERSPRPGALRVFGASLVAPGAGQWMLGSRRTYLYLGLELLGWAGYLERRSSALRQRDRYRDLAWEVARDRSGPRIGGGFAYYEAIARFPASGAWDADPDRPGLQPETDPSTYNGAVWQLARQLHLGGGETPDPSTPGYEAALAYYRERGYRTELSWDWTDEPRAARRYRSLVESSDERFRTATLVLGGIVANHLLSAVDAYVTVRAAPEIRRIVPGRSGRDLFGRWSLRIRLPARP